MRFPEVDPVWTIAVEGFDVRTNRHHEGILTTGSGYLHVRGSLEEGLTDDPQDREYVRRPDDVTLERRAAQKSKWGTYIPGIVGPHPLLNEEIINLPWFLGLSIAFLGEWLNLERSSVANHLRVLDLRDGTLHRRLNWRTASGAELELEWHRFISLARKNLSIQELKVRVVHGHGRLVIETGIDAAVRTSGYDHFVEKDFIRVDANRLACRIRTNGGNLVAIASSISPGESWQYESDGNRARLAGEYELEPGAELRMLKLAAVATDRDLSAGDPLARAGSDLDAAGSLGLPALHAEHAAAWSQRWRWSDVLIEGDPEAQHAMRFSIHHLIRSHPGDPRVAVCPKGYTGDAYFGRFFWDTEMYLLPFFIYTNPSAARDLVLFRHNTLPGARRNAVAQGYRGAKYAWESSLDGTEQCPNWQYADLEIHITAAVVYGLLHYVLATGDTEFLDRYGLEIMLETARYWVERVDPDPEPGRYNLLGAMGPDEYTPFSRNNAFTVHLVKFALAATTALLREMESERPRDYTALAERLGLTPAELESFAAVERGLRVPRRQDLVLQAEDFPDLANLDLSQCWPDRSLPLGHFVSRERRYRSKCLKQADVLALMALFPQDFTVAEMRQAFEYYEPLTSHDSSLSPAVHAVVAAWLRRTTQAFAFFRRSAEIDLDPRQEGASEGIHIANAGGNWMAVVYGFAGVRSALQSKILSVDPHLPEHWRRLEFTLYWRGCPIRLSIDHHQIGLANLGSCPIAASLAGIEINLAPGGETAVPFPSGVASSNGSTRGAAGCKDSQSVAGMRNRRIWAENG